MNTIFGYGIFALFLYLGFHYSICAILSTILGVIFSFKTQGILVFNNSSNKLIFKFVSVYVIMCLLNILLLKIVEVLMMDLYLAGFCTICLIAIISFFVNKYWVFKR